VVFSGARGPDTPAEWVSEAAAFKEVFVREAVALGLTEESFAHDLIIEDQSTDAGKNVRFSMGALRREGRVPAGGAIIVIAAPAFQRRMALTWFKQSGLSLPVVSFSPSRRPLAAQGLSDRSRTLGLVAGEAGRLVRYAAPEDGSEPFIAPVNVPAWVRDLVPAIERHREALDRLSAPVGAMLLPFGLFGGGALVPASHVSSLTDPAFWTVVAALAAVAVLAHWRAQRTGRPVSNARAFAYLAGVLALAAFVPAFTHVLGGTLAARATAWAAFAVGATVPLRRGESATPAGRWAASVVDAVKAANGPDAALRAALEHVVESAPTPALGLSRVGRGAQIIQALVGPSLDDGKVRRALRDQARARGLAGWSLQRVRHAVRALPARAINPASPALADTLLMPDAAPDTGLNIILVSASLRSRLGLLVRNVRDSNVPAVLVADGDGVAAALESELVRRQVAARVLSDPALVDRSEGNENPRLRLSAVEGAMPAGLLARAERVQIGLPAGYGVMNDGLSGDSKLNGATLYVLRLIDALFRTVPVRLADFLRLDAIALALQQA
jgi:hypothetical protein